MWPDDRDDTPFNRFLVASILIHALVLFLYPSWLQDMLSGASLQRGGVVEVMIVDSRPARQAVAPARQQVRPPAQSRPQPQAAPQPQPARVPVEETVPRPNPTPAPEPPPAVPQLQEVQRPAPPAPVEPAPEPRPQPPREAPPVPNPSEMLSSQAGRTEVPAPAEREPREQVVAPSEPSRPVPAESRPAEPQPIQPEPVQPSPAPGPQPLAPPGDTPAPAALDGLAEADPEAELAGSAAAREGTEAEGDDEESVPAPLGRDMVRFGGDLTYPKTAQDRALTGTVVVEVTVAGETGRARELRVAESSGHNALDQAAQWFVRERAVFERAPSDYRVWVAITFHRSETPDGRTSYGVDIVVRDRVEMLP